MADGAYIDRDGLHLPDYPTTLTALQDKVRGIFGEDLYLEPDSQEGQLVAIFALAQQDTYNLSAAVYNAFSPQTAQGAGLSRMVVINGIRRQSASYSTVPVACIGTAGTSIKGGIAEDGAGQKWHLPASVTIPTSGEIHVTATAQDIGDVRAAAGEVNKIATPCRGWQSVSNPQAATPGAAVEKDAALRSRQAISTALPSQTVFEGTLGAVGNVGGVTRWRGYENDTSTVDANALPPHSICLVVEGGDSAAIAEAIALKKTPGCYTLGDIEVMTRDSKGLPNAIRFYRPIVVHVRLRVTLQPLAGYLSTTGSAIKSNIAAHINALRIGDDVLASRLLTPINAADATGTRTFDVLKQEYSTDGEVWHEGNIAIAFNAAATCDVDDISLPGVE